MNFDRQAYAISFTKLIPAVVLNENIQAVLDVKQFSGVGWPRSQFNLIRCKVRAYVCRQLNFKISLNFGFSRTSRVFHNWNVSLVLSHSVKLLVQTKISLVKLKLKTFDGFVTLAVVANYFDCSFCSSIEFVLIEQNLGSAAGASHSPHSTNNIV